MATTKQATCKRCGSTRVAWVKSKRTGNFYLAFATYSSGNGYVDHNGHGSSSASGWRAHPQTPHDCKSANRGGYDACQHCHRHHVVMLHGTSTWSAEDWATFCAGYPDAPEGVPPVDPAAEAMRDLYANHPEHVAAMRLAMAADHPYHPDRLMGA